MKRRAWLTVRQIGWEQKAFWRNPSAAVFTFAFPVMFLVIFVAVYGNNTVHIAGHRLRYAQYFVPSILAFGLISACYNNLAFALSIQRDRGILKRVRGTPLRPATYLAGLVGNTIIVSLIITALTAVMGVVFYGVHFPGRYGGLFVTILAGAFCFSALGFAVSTFVPNEDAAPPIINFILFPLLFISGTFSPIADSSALAKFASLFPVRHLIKLTVAVFSPFGGGSGLSANHLAVLVVWGVGATAVTLRRFRWEPRRV